MNKITSIVVGVLVVISMALSVASYNRHIPTQLGAQGAPGLKGDRGAQGPAGPMGPRGADAPRVLGALTGPEIPSPYIVYGGVPFWAQNAAMKTIATSTPCALQSPASTSTLTYASARIITSTSSATILTLATSTTAFATTSVLVTSSVSANNLASIAWTPTQGGTVPGLLMAPNTFVVLGTTGPGLLGTVIGGQCQATWIVL